MTRTKAALAIVLLLATAAAYAQFGPMPDLSPHKVQMVTVADGVELEVLDWGGNGPPLVFLAGLGNTGHDFDAFVPRFVSNNHVYAITRRGFGASSKPAPDDSNYSANRLGDDVLAVMDALKLDRPVLVGHSAAGEELSSVASRHPDRVAGVIYLDAAYAYAYYAPGNLNPANANLTLDANEIRDKVQALGPIWQKPQDVIAALDVLQKSELPKLEADIRAAQAAIPAYPPAPSMPPRPPRPQGASQSPQARIVEAITGGVRRFGTLKVPVLAIFASPEAAPPGAPPEFAAYALGVGKLVKPGLIHRYRKGNPSARVVEIADAQHFIFRSHPDPVAQEIEAFLSRLSK